MVADQRYDHKPEARDHGDRRDDRMQRHRTQLRPRRVSRRTVLRSTRGEAALRTRAADAIKPVRGANHDDRVAGGEGNLGAHALSRRRG